MFSKTWKTSERKYRFVVERDLRIVMSDGTEISADIFRPDTDEKFPAILGIHPFLQQPQTAPIKPYSFSSVTFRHPLEEKGRGWLESGDPNFLVRRGYVQVVANVRGTGKSGGKYDFMGPQEIQDTYEVIEWIAKQPWCNGKVGMFGVSYFAWIQIFVAALNPPSLKCIFAPHGLTDFYRDWIYRGGIFGYKFIRALAPDLSNPRFECITRKKFGEKELKEAIMRALQDEDLMAIPGIAEILKKHNAVIVKADAHPPEYKGHIEKYTNTPIFYIEFGMSKEAMIGQFKRRLLQKQIEIQQKSVDTIKQLRYHRRHLRTGDDIHDALILSCYEPKIPFDVKPQPCIYIDGKRIT